jgi:hypothetical protein
MTDIWGLGALLRAFGSLSRPFDNKSICHDKAEKIPSLRGARSDEAIHAAFWIASSPRFGE